MAGTVCWEKNGQHWRRQKGDEKEKTRRDGQEWIDRAMDQHKGALADGKGRCCLGSAGCSRARQTGGDSD